MIITHHWEKKDLKFGSYLCQYTWSEDSDDISGLCSVTYKLGWKGGSRDCCCLISISDGMVLDFPKTEHKSGEEVLLEELNKNGNNYRPLTAKQVTRRINYLLKGVNQCTSSKPVKMSN